VYHVCVLCVLALSPLVLASIRRFETDLIRSFRVGLSYDVRSLSTEGIQPIPNELIDRGESSLSGEKPVFFVYIHFSVD